MADIAERGRRRPIAVARRPVYAILLPVPIVCFAGALLTDIAYAMTEILMWLNFSGWLLAAGLFFGLIAGIFLLVDFLRLPNARVRVGWAHLLLFLAAWIVELVNMLVHNRDGWTAVVPLGMTLSVIGLLLILAAGWLWRPLEAETAR